MWRLYVVSGLEHRYPNFMLIKFSWRCVTDCTGKNDNSLEGEGCTEEARQKQTVWTGTYSLWCPILLVYTQLSFLVLNEPCQVFPETILIEIKYTCTNPLSSNFPINVENLEDENTFLQHLNGCGLSPPSCNSITSPPSTAALSTAGAKFKLLLQSLLISLLKYIRCQLVDKWEDSFSSLLRLGSAWPRQTRSEKNHTRMNLNRN